MLTENKNKIHTFYGIEFQFLDQDSEGAYERHYQNTEWFMCEGDMLAAIEEHNKVAYWLREKLKEANLDISYKALLQRQFKTQDENLDKPIEFQSEMQRTFVSERLNWYDKVGKLVDQLDAERAKYGIAPYPMEILDASSNDWVPIETKKIEVSIFGMNELLNGREILDPPRTLTK